MEWKELWFMQFSQIGSRGKVSNKAQLRVLEKKWLHKRRREYSVIGNSILCWTKILSLDHFSTCLIQGYEGNHITVPKHEPCVFCWLAVIMWKDLKHQGKSAGKEPNITPIKSIFNLNNNSCEEISNSCFGENNLTP